MKYLAISRQNRPAQSQSSSDCRVKIEIFFNKKREIHVFRLFQKELVFGQFQNKWSKFSGSSSQKLRMSESFIQTLFKNVVVAFWNKNVKDQLWKKRFNYGFQGADRGYIPDVFW